MVPDPPREPVGGRDSDPSTSSGIENLERSAAQDLERSAAQDVERSAAQDVERRQRWRLLLGEPAQEPLQPGLSVQQQGMDRALAALYEPEPGSEPDPGHRRRGGL